MSEFQLEIIVGANFRVFKVSWRKGPGVETFCVHARNGELVVECDRPHIERLGKDPSEIN